MHRTLKTAFFIISICTALPAAAQNATNTQATNMTSGEDVSARYEAANEAWRINVILYILKDRGESYSNTMKNMRDFNAVSRSYVIFKRKGHSEAEEIYYRNLENMSRLEQIKQLLDGYRKDFTSYNKDFMGSYKLEERDFSDFNRFETGYERILTRWRGEFEAAMKANKKDEIRRIRQDMQLLRVAISAFILFPGKSANKVNQLQKMENDVRHAVVMLKMYETAAN